MKIKRTVASRELTKDIIRELIEGLPNVTKEQLDELRYNDDFFVNLNGIVRQYDVYSKSDCLKGRKSKFLTRLSIIPFGITLVVLQLLLPIMFLFYGEFKYSETVVNFMQSWKKAIFGR
jgi:hypothetical protein